MRKASCIFALLLFAIVFTGQSVDTNELDDFPEKWHSTVKIHVSSDNDPIAFTIKDYLLAEFRKIPDITVVDEGGHFLISIVAIETNASVVLSLCFRKPYRDNFLKTVLEIVIPEEKFKSTYALVENDTRNLEEFLNQQVAIFPRHKLEERCREIVVEFDARTLQEYRELYEHIKKEQKDK